MMYIFEKLRTLKTPFLNINVFETGKYVKYVFSNTGSYPLLLTS